MVSFHSVRLPVDVEKGAQGGPNFHTSILTLSSGFEKRNADWSRTRASYDISYGIQSKENCQDVLEFFYARFGRLYGFRFRDWGDYEIGVVQGVGSPQQIGVGDAVTVAYQMYKRYSSGGFNFDRKITRPCTGTILVYVNAVLQTETTDYTIDYETGLITFVTPPAVKATQTLTGDGTNVSDGDTVVINSIPYTFQASLTNVDGHVKIGGSAAASLTNLFHAINASGGVPGTDYATAMTANAYVTATNPSGTTVVVTSKLAGTVGNSYTVSRASGGTPHVSWGAATLLGGVAGLILISGEFDVPVRFDADKLNLINETFNAAAVGAIQLVELKE